MASSSAPMWSSPGLTREAMESVAISTSARGAVLSWKDWGAGGRREEGEGRRRKGGERSMRSMRDSTKAHLGTTGNMDELFSFMQA